MKKYFYLKVIFKDLLLSIFFSAVMFDLLRYFFYLKLDISQYISLFVFFIVFFIVFSFSSILSFYMFKLKNQIDFLNVRVMKLSKFDEVTDIYKRVYFFEIAEKYFNISKRKDIPLSLMLIDIDDFKYFNKLYGHEFSDKILKRIGNIIKNEIRGMDVVGRYGEDEFIIISFSSKEELYSLAKRLNKMFNDLKIDNKKISISTSIGIAEMSKNEKLEDLIKKAEEAIYLAKTKGGNRVDYLEHFLLFE